MTTVDIARRWLRTPAATIAAAVLLISAAAVAAGTARDGDDRQVLVTVTAYPPGAAQIATQGGDTVIPVWGQPTELSAAPAGVSVITWAADRGASCTVWIDGAVVVEQTVAAAGQPASCVWP